MDINVRTGATRNQSAADFSLKRIFIFDNKFSTGIFKNKTSEIFQVEAGMLLSRDKSDNSIVKTTAANLDAVIGISTETLPELAPTIGESIVNFGVKGTVNSNHIILPDSVTLQTTVGNVTLSDYLENLGFHLESSTEHTKLDN